MTLFKLTYQILILFDAPKIHTNLLWDLTILFSSITIIYFLGILFFRNKVYRQSSNRGILKILFSPKISDFLFYDESGTEINSSEEKNLNSIAIGTSEILKRETFQTKEINAGLVQKDACINGEMNIKDFEVIFETLVVQEARTDLPKEKYTNDNVTDETIEKLLIELAPVLKNIDSDLEELMPSEVDISFEIDEELSDDMDFEIIFNNSLPPLRIPKIDDIALRDIVVSNIEVLEDDTEQLELAVVCEIEDEAEENKYKLPKWLLDEIAREQPNYNREELNMDGPEWKEKESQMMDRIQDYFKKLPPGGDNDDNGDDENPISDVLQLLDDIELFGDEREIPLLQELIEKEDKQQTKDRLEGLMKRFSGKDIYGKGLDSSSTYSVFEELFRNCDTESKLILLDEIVLVGDQKEAHFLEQLLADPSAEIRKKAADSLKKINERLNRVRKGTESNDADAYERFINMMDLDPPKELEETPYYQIDFDLDFKQDEIIEKIKEPKKGRSNANFFSKFMAKFIRKDK